MEIYHLQTLKPSCCKTRDQEKRNHVKYRDWTVKRDYLAESVCYTSLIIEQQGITYNVLALSVWLAISLPINSFQREHVSFYRGSDAL